MISDWRFDVRNPYENSFEEALLQVADSQAIVDMIKIKCNEIRKDPKANFRGFVHGRFVYIAKTGPVKTATMTLDPLLVVYTLDEQKKLIQRVFVCKAVSVGESSHTASMAAMGNTLRRAIQTALQKARSGPDS